MHLTQLTFTTLAAAGTSIALGFIPLGGCLAQPSPYKVVRPIPLVLAKANGAPVPGPTPPAACAASCIPLPVTVTAPAVTLPAPPPVTLPAVTTTLLAVTIYGPQPASIAYASSICADDPSKPNPVFDDSGSWACCVGSWPGSGVGCV